MKEYSAIVLGAGFAGAATAYHLSRIGIGEVLVLEREPAAGRHASGRNACLLRQAVECEESARWIQETRRALENPPADWPNREVFRAQGSLLLGEHAALKALRKILSRVGGRAELFRRAELKLDFFRPWKEILAKADFEALLFSPEDGVVDVAGYLQNLVAAAQDRGVEYRFACETTGFRRENGGWRVLAGGGEFFGRCLINAAGAWADELAAANGLERRKLEPMRRHLFASKKSSWHPPPGTYLWDLRHGCYFRPHGEGLLLCAGDETPHPASSLSLDPSVEAELFKKLRQYFPSLAGLEVAEAWACLRTFGPEKRPLDPADPRAPGLFWAAGLGGHGVGLSLGLGRKVAGAVHEFLVGRPEESL
ncbi:MAG TPA: FAD-dependent oxidoreductase [bacterium]|nr:FAD-dependent oxidoreductase [bacterium]